METYQLYSGKLGSSCRASVTSSCTRWRCCWYSSHNRQQQL